MKILAPNRHEIYFLIFSYIGYEIDILTSLPNEELGWRFPQSELPSNLHLVPWDRELEQKIEEGYYDVAVILTLKDLLFFRRFKSLKIIQIIHIALYHHSIKLKLRWLVKRALLAWVTLSNRVTVAFSSPWKKSTWWIKNAPVIQHPPLPTLDVLPPADGVPKAVTVGNHLNAREEVDFSLFEALRREVDIDIIGENPGVPGAITPKSRGELYELLRQYQIFVFLLQHPWEDGYNLAVLEAMQSGMAIVSLAHPTSLIEQGKNGYQCQNVSEMIERIRFLKAHPELVQAMGERSKAIVKQSFAMDRFVRQWHELIHKVVDDQATAQSPM